MSNNDALLIAEFLDLLYTRESQIFEKIQKETPPKQFSEEEVAAIFDSYKHDLRAIKRFHNKFKKAIKASKS